jgi:hypothetical protein
MSAAVELGDYPAPAWNSDEGGRCAKCAEPCKKYGSGANPLCRNCFAVVAGAWGPGVRQQGYNV